MNRYLYATLPFPDLFEPRGTCYVDGDGGDGTNGAGGGNGAGNGDGSQTPTPAPAGPDWNQFIGGLDQLNSQMGGKLDTLIDTVRTVTAPADPEPAPPPDFDAMGNAELHAHIVGSVTRAVEQMLTERLAPITTAIDNTNRTLTTANVQNQIKELQTVHKDFNDWKTEMIDLAKENPTLSVPRLYALARAENPAKAGDLDRKYTPPVAPKPLPFGGLTPGSRGKAGAPPVLDALTAGREAYREVAERHPGVLAALSDL